MSDAKSTRNSDANRIQNPEADKAMGETASHKPLISVNQASHPRTAGGEAWIEDSSLGSWIYVKRDSLNKTRAAELFDICAQELPWYRPTGAKGKKWPREAAWVTEPPRTCHYRYGGQDFAPHPTPPFLLECWREAGRRTDTESETADGPSQVKTGRRTGTESETKRTTTNKSSLRKTCPSRAKNNMCESAPG